MSFILDALKKSETERQRGDAPALYETKMAPPRRTVAPWLIVLAALLVINIIVLTVVLLRGTRGAAAPTDSATPPVTAGTPGAAPSPAMPEAAANPAPPAAPPAPAVSAPGTAPAPQPAAGGTGADAASGGADPSLGGTANGAAHQSDDDAPAAEPAGGTPGEAGHGRSLVQATGGGSGELPTYQQAAATPGANLPDLTLNLHAYAANPADRFVFLNMIRLQEGQTSPQGVRVEAITPDGAILSWQGSRFLLQRQ